MHILVRNGWQDGYLNAHRAPGEMRVRVSRWIALEALDDLYFRRPHSPRMVLNYLRELGPIEVARKIVSRSRETARNEKFVACGLGTVIEADDPAAVGAGVYFLAPCHPHCAESVVVPDRLTCADPTIDARADNLYFSDYTTRPASSAWWAPLRGWMRESGELPAVDSAVLRQVAGAVTGTDWSEARRLSRSNGTVAERTVLPDGAGDRPAATLFGYGNYAKTVVLPNIQPHVQVTCIHEIDPTQIPRGDTSRTWDTAPFPRSDERFDALLIAGYHHTHAPLAIEALRRGAYAVVEKPLVTDEAQLTELIGAVRATPKLFACFQRRYLPFNDMAREDLNVRAGEPVSYHAIVYEVPLPSLHWYRWPASRSRLVSNGCHWIDHFLFLNGYDDVWTYDVTVARDGTVSCSVELRNGAFFTMVLTEQGSERIGVQDHVELRARGVTVKLVNASSYEAAGPDRIIRRRRINRIRSYQRMYETIGRSIAAGQVGDSLRSVEVGSSLMLALEQRFTGVTREREEDAGVRAGSSAERVDS